MPRKLLTATALLASTHAVAAPPVDGARVTGNVSTEHAVPKLDACRVTGNIQRLATKRADPPPSACRIATGATVRALTDHVTYTETDCVVQGRVVEVDQIEVCRIGETTPLDVPLQDAVRVSTRQNDRS